MTTEYHGTPHPRNRESEPDYGRLNLIRLGLIIRRLSILSGIPSDEIWRDFRRACARREAREMTRRGKRGAA